MPCGSTVPRVAGYGKLVMVCGHCYHVSVWCYSHCGARHPARCDLSTRSSHIGHRGDPLSSVSFRRALPLSTLSSITLQLNLPVNLTKSSSKLGCRLIDCCQPNSLQGTRQLLANRVSSPGPTSSLPSYARLLSTSDRRSSPARPEIRTRISHPTPDTSEAIRDTQRHEALRERFRGRCERAVNGLRGGRPLRATASTLLPPIDSSASTSNQEAVTSTLTCRPSTPPYRHSQ